MYSFPISLLPFLGIINLFGDVIITVINGYICPSANVTVHIQSTGIPYRWILQSQGPGCHPCHLINPSKRFHANQVTFTDQETTVIQRIQFFDPGPPFTIYTCYFGDAYYVLRNVTFGFQLNSSDHVMSDQLIGINVLWLWEWDGSPIAISDLHINIEQKDNYPYNVKSPRNFKCELNLTYSITVEHDCPLRKETTITETTRSKSHLTTTKMPKRKANNKKNEKLTKKKIDPRLINSLAVSGSAVIIVIVVSLVMYFGWYKRKLNQLGLIPQNATTPVQN